MPASLENHSDIQLAHGAQGAPGREGLACFEEIVRRYQMPLVHFLSRRFPSRRDVEDIVQDTFLKAWQSLHLYNPRRSLRTWLYTIAYRTAVSQGRRDRGTMPLSPAMCADGPSPQARAQQQDERLTLWQRAREVLSEEQFTALWLHYVDDLPARDIGRILNRSWVNVKTMMYRARKKLEPFVRESPHVPARICLSAPAALKAGGG